MSTKKVVLEFNESRFKAELSTLRYKANQLTDALKSVKKITDGKVVVLDLEELDNHLNDSTGFKNPMMSADALNVKSEYAKIVATIPQTISEFIELKGDEYVVNEKGLKESLTHYMAASHLKEYNALVDLVSKMNKYPMHVLGSISMRGDSVTIDPLQYNTRKQMR